MKRLENIPENIPEAVRVLKAGGIIAHPADTCYGLAADLMNPDALRQLQELKGRDASKPLSIMLPAYLKPRLSDFAALNDFSEMVGDRLLPGPVTIILPKGPKIPDYFFPDLKTVGIRIPYDRMTNDMLTKFHGPLITTSANLSSQPVCCDAKEIRKTFEHKKHRPDLLLEGDIQNHCMPSTVISLKENRISILREGPLKREQLEAILGFSIE